MTLYYQENPCKAVFRKGSHHVVVTTRGLAVYDYMGDVLTNMVQELDALSVKGGRHALLRAAWWDTTNNVVHAKAVILQPRTSLFGDEDTGELDAFVRKVMHILNTTGVDGTGRSCHEIPQVKVVDTSSDYYDPITA